MEDDVKNLFQKIGKPVAGYQEINRTAVTEQARKRWPLLRDVNIHSLPGDAAMEDDEVATLADLPDLAQSTTINPSLAKNGLKHLFKSEPPALVASPAQAIEHSSGFFNRLQTKHDEEAQARVTPVVNSLFAKVQLANGAHHTLPSENTAAAKVQQAQPVRNQSVSANKPQTSTQSGFFQTAAYPVQPAARTVTPEVSNGNPVTAAEPDLHAVFNRLAGKPETNAAPAATKSFFNKIFKS